MNFSKVGNCLRGRLREVGWSPASAETGENVQPQRLMGPRMTILPAPYLWLRCGDSLSGDSLNLLGRDEGIPGGWESVQIEFSYRELTSPR